MNWIRERVLKGECVFGTFMTMGSVGTANLAGRLGLDWVLLDTEHGIADETLITAQLLVLASTPAASLLRVKGKDPIEIVRALERGAAGVMVPMINNADEARTAVNAMRYIPEGTRSSGQVLGCQLPGDWQRYVAEADENVLAIMQIETLEGLANVEEIAAVPEVDVLFIGPSDLSMSLGIFGQVEHPRMCEAVERIVQAAQKYGKAVGSLVGTQEQVEQRLEQGFTFMGLGSETGLLMDGLTEIARTVEALRHKHVPHTAQV